MHVANSKLRFRAEASSGRVSRAVPPGSQTFPEGEFLILLGERVRGMRLLCAMSRRELARRSGVSERYIAQIEAGRGNVSIVLLLRIAQAIRSG
jgi:XRE family aerobic/anaerobic benzoate catabolism transcriptional regulator